MATILLQAAGAYLGGMLGPVGSVIGTAAGALAGFAVDTALINATRRIEGPRLTGARPFTAEEGVSLPRVYGTARMGGILIWATRFEESSETRRQGKLGPRVTEYTYYANVAFALCEGEIAGIRRIWADGREIDRESVELRIYQGSEDQPQDPLIEAKQGEGNAPAYRGVAYVVLDRFDVGDYGNRIPQLQFEVIRPIGRLSRQVRAVSLLPGAIEYGLSPVVVTRTQRPGEEQAVNRNVLFAGTDISASLDELQAVCPNLEHVALISTWFGDDLRAGFCRVRPAVTDAGETGFSSEWTVSGLPRAQAPVVSIHDGGAAYGGTPSDRSVLDAIAEIKDRGLSVTLYPFMMMDIATDNALPDPEGGASQPPYPWRGRITCDPAPGRPGSADKAEEARTQVAAFCGAAQPADFAAAADTVLFSGAPDDWGYRRLVLHYAHLAAQAGGVDAFLIGSELRGLTRLRDGAGNFPFVEELCALAADVRAVLGPAARITYGADWSEYFGYHPADGSGDVYFNLDPLWSHPAVDAVGIDNYMPLSDWRDSDHAAAIRTASRTVRSVGLKRPWPAARDSTGTIPAPRRGWAVPARRSPTAPMAAWTYPLQGHRLLVSNPHHDRVAGVEQPQPRLGATRQADRADRTGLPAVDKGPNQPNVFPDPKSSEGGSPYFSTGGRSDVAPALLEPTWRIGMRRPRFPGGRQSAVAGSMAAHAGSFAHLSLAWDARPFPAFPCAATCGPTAATGTSAIAERAAGRRRSRLAHQRRAGHHGRAAGRGGQGGRHRAGLCARRSDLGAGGAGAAGGPVRPRRDRGARAARLPHRRRHRRGRASGDRPRAPDDGPEWKRRSPDQNCRGSGADLPRPDDRISGRFRARRAPRRGRQPPACHELPGVWRRAGRHADDEWLKRAWYQREFVTFRCRSRAPTSCPAPS